MKHYYDVWHIAKGTLKCIAFYKLFGTNNDCNSGLRKKMNALAKQKECDIIGKREKSVINHLYWCVSSSAADDQTLIKAKWLSIVNHVHNKHTGHGCKEFPKCLHKRLQGRDRKKKWIKPSTSCTAFDFNFYVAIIMACRHKG